MHKYFNDNFTMSDPIFSVLNSLEKEEGHFHMSSGKMLARKKFFSDLIDSGLNVPLTKCLHWLPCDCRIFNNKTKALLWKMKMARPRGLGHYRISHHAQSLRSLPSLHSEKHHVFLPLR